MKTVTDFVNGSLHIIRRMRFRALVVVLMVWGSSGVYAANDPIAELGRSLFNDTSLSRDGRTSCQSCHDPLHAYADPRPRSVGTNGQVG
ncbi:MAG: hypothetical protein E6K53_11670, partial [Gammaproteobacteria bacterium]